MNFKTNVLLAITIVASFSIAQELKAAEKKQTLSQAACEVWSREKSFAESVERHDAKAFVEHIDTNAVFVSGDGSFTRGNTEVAKAWAGIIEGKNVILRWHPDFVGLSSDGKTAISRGPYWIENPDPNAKQKFMTGNFQSTWVKDKKSQWHVFADGGTPGPVPATPEQVQALKQTLSPSCPHSER
jgi:ketosteroid isomerase-like protein